MLNSLPYWSASAQATPKPFPLAKKLRPHYRDQPKLISVVKESRLQLEEQMAQERAGK